MLKTETRALILGDVLTRANNPLRGQPADLAEPARMTDAQIEADHVDAMARVANITRQLDDDREMNCSRGDAWRKRAMGARRVQLAQIDRLVIEARRRGLAFVRVVAAPETARGLNGAPLPDAEQYRALERRQQARERQAAIEAATAARKDATRRAEAEQAAAKAAARLALTRARADLQAAEMQARAARREAVAARDRRQERCFITAAKDLLGEDACREIWERARAIFPDPAIWA